jgi:hypothetical protein
MNNKSFYRRCYLQTGGWLPMSPLTQAITLGDFCQIRRGKLRPLGNIAQLIDSQDIRVSQPMLLAQEDWLFNRGVEQTSCETMPGESGDRVEQSLSFADQDSYLFFVQQPKAQYVSNWQQIKSALTLQLTQAKHAFRQLYIVTAVASSTDWAGAVAGTNNAHLKLSAQTTVGDCYSLLRHPSVYAQQSQGIADFHQHSQSKDDQPQTDSPCYFYQAKKRVLSGNKKEQLIQSMLKQVDAQSPMSLANWQQTDLLNRVGANELNTANCLDYFDWVDISLDEVELLCPNQ